MTQAGTTKIGKYLLNHSFMIRGFVATSVAVITPGLFLAGIMFRAHGARLPGRLIRCQGCRGTQGPAERN